MQVQVQGQTQGNEVNLAWAEGLRRLPVLRFFRFHTLVAGSSWRRWLLVYLLVALVTIALPLSVQLVGYLWGLDFLYVRSVGGLYALVFTVALSFVIAVFSGTGWVVLGRRIDWFDILLPRESRVTAARALRLLYKHAWWGPVIGLAGAAAILATAPTDGVYLPSNLVSALALITLAAIAGWALLSALWVPALVSVFGKTPMAKLRFLRVQFSSTPGVVVMSEAIALGSLALSTAFLFVAAMWLYVKYSPALLPAYMENSFLLIGAVLLLLIARVVAAPTIWIHLKLMEVKSYRLFALSKELEKAGSARFVLPMTKARLAASITLEMAVVGESPTLPSRAVALLPFASAIVGSAVAFLLVWSLGNPPA